MLATIEPATLTRDEADELADHEAIIEQSQAVFVEVGNALMAIRDAKLYRASHPTFDAYLAERWPAISKRRGYQLIDAAAIATVVPITNERQARALKGVPAEQAKQAFAVASAATGGQPTGKAIEQALRPEKLSSGLPVDFSAYEAKALACNLRLIYDGEYHVTGAADGTRTSSQWSVTKSFLDASERTYQLQAQALAATQVQRPSQELLTARRYQSKLSSGMHNLDNPKDRQQVRQLCGDLLECLNTIDGLPSLFDKAIEAVLTQAADLLADDDYADLAKRLEGVVVQ